MMGCCKKKGGEDPLLLCKYRRSAAHRHLAGVHYNANRLNELNEA